MNLSSAENKPLVDAIAKVIEGELSGVTVYDFRQIAEDRIAPGRALEQFEVMQRFIPGNYTGWKVLEIGSSFSSYQAYLLERGLKAFGVEPSMDAIRLGRQAWPNLNGGQLNAVGEFLPFKSETFDLIYSSNVLEHVQDTHKTVAEALRVLKPGGYFQFVFPNYGSIWDGHYSLPWIPYAPYWVGKAYVRLFGRSPHYVDTLQLLNIFKVRRILAEHPNVRVITLGSEVFAERLNRQDFKAWAGMGRLDRPVKWMQKLRVTRLAAFAADKLALYTPFIVTLQKNR